MLQWSLYVLVVSALLSAAAWLAERGLRQSNLQTRWAWVAAMSLIVGLAYVSIAGLTTARAADRMLLQKTWTSIQHLAPVTLPSITPQAATSAAYAATMQWDAVFVRLWLLLSASVMLVLASSGVYVFLRRRAWPRRLIDSHCVGITLDTGPAVVGLIRPTIAIPRWVLDKAAAQQQLILAHEASHLQARDPLLLTGSLVVLVLMPWNFLLWWQWHRLRHAIEVDCDARVLRAGHDTQAYGEALIDVGEQRSRFVGVVAAMSETRTLLERRIEIMAMRTRKSSTYAFAVLSALAAMAVAAATQVTSPDTATNRQAISVDPATLDRYVGKYQLGPHYILTVTRNGSQLYTQVTADPNQWPIYAETPNEFFWKITNTELTFVVNNGGAASSATIQQNGHDRVAPRLDDAAAQAIEQWLTERVSQQQPMAGSEAALRRTIAAVGAGTPDYDDMTRALQDLTRQQLPVLIADFKDYGPVQSMEFKGVNDLGTDKYLVTHQSGKQTEWFIVLDADGKISYLLFRKAF